MFFKETRNWILLVIGCILLCVCSAVPAMAADADDKTIPLNQYGIRSLNPYVVDRFTVDGRQIDKIIVPSRSTPPIGFTRQAATVPKPDIAAGTNSIANVPAMTWAFGCSATSAAMMFGHYDNTVFPNMYAGPTNGGVFPMTNATWGSVLINGQIRALCPLSATRLGLDGRTSRGHVDDYWVMYPYSDDEVFPDPYLTNGWPQHTYGDCTGDYMGTNQSELGNTDGGTTFYSYTNGAPLYDFTYYEPAERDGCHGMRLFAESRGYTVDTNFSQYIYGYGGNTQGFTFEDYKTEIDAGRPVIIQVSGHSMLGFGYNDTGPTVYLHDTWDCSDHSMTWGGYYSDMRHYGVAVIRLDVPPVPVTCPECPANGVIANVTYPVGISCSCTNAVAITLGTGVTIPNGAIVTFTAPVVNVGPGFHAENGANVTIRQP